jgi:threonyl-tRNA synthetase
MRVRGFTQDDAHIFCTPDQVEAEVLRGAAASRSRMLRAFGFEKIQAYLSTRPEKAVGEQARLGPGDRESAQRRHRRGGIGVRTWTRAAARSTGRRSTCTVQDALGRLEWQMTTIQFDFNLPERFDMTFVGRGRPGAAAVHGAPRAP